MFSKIMWFHIKLLFMYRAINPIGWSFEILSQSHGNIWIKISLCYSRCPAIYMVNFIQIFPAVHTYTFIHIDVLHSLTFAFIRSIKISINIASCLSMVMLSLVESFSFNHLYSNYIVSNKQIMQQHIRRMQRLKREMLLWGEGDNANQASESRVRVMVETLSY